MISYYELSSLIKYMVIECKYLYPYHIIHSLRSSMIYEPYIMEYFSKGLDIGIYLGKRCIYIKDMSKYFKIDIYLCKNSYNKLINLIEDRHNIIIKSEGYFTDSELGKLIGNFIFNSSTGELYGLK